MLGAVDAIKRPLKIPPRFVPYLEKHRIYELFHELATQVVIKKPKDHLLFFKQSIHHAARSRDVARIIILAPPYFDKMRLGEVLQEETGARLITLKNIHAVESGCIQCSDFEDVARNMRKIMRTGMLNNGWVLVDVPRTKAEARAFQRIGILPTHVIEIKPDQVPECTCSTNVMESFYEPDRGYKSFKNSEYRSYKKQIRGLREAYSNFLTEVEVGSRTIEDLGKDCATLTKTKKHCGAPSLFRVVLLGARGSGSSTTAKYLSRRFNLVHVNFNDILEQARLQETKLGEAIRLFEHRWGSRPKPETRIQIVEKQVLGHECIKRGWVLTGYPICVEDFKLLDQLSTPPNRVIFIDVDSIVCRDRLLGRRYNMKTGSKHHLSTIQNFKGNQHELGVHPKDYISVVEQDFEEFENNVVAMKAYAGSSAITIDGSVEKRTVQEKVEACLMRPAPCAPPRVPRPPPEVNPEDIEFDPDDAPDPRVFDEIRAPESTISLI
ncbi:adenylate kinase 8 [Orussus abietinus]|uniref:adenylate kinase 8 n=1 Tax=Orussus abietinus TaxID=222816 RepID=UPI000C715F77|nr:adenylate kinase 8 [Orussus abietinus]